MTPTPLPSPSPAKSALKTSAPQPIATVTVTGTVKVVQDRDPVPLEDQLQGWGTVAAVFAALVVALIGWLVEGRRRKKDREAGDRERARDREDADRRLHEERAVGDRRLREQFEYQNERDRREYLVKQIERVADFYTKFVAAQRLTSTDAARNQYKNDPGMLALRILPEDFATLVRLQVRGQESAEAARRLDLIRGDDGKAYGPAVHDATFAELVDNVNELLSRAEHMSGEGHDGEILGEGTL